MSSTLTTDNLVVLPSNVIAVPRSAIGVYNLFGYTSDISSRLVDNYVFVSLGDSSIDLPLLVLVDSDRYS